MAKNGGRKKKKNEKGGSTEDVRQNDSLHRTRIDGKITNVCKRAGCKVSENTFM